jgi:hypothetical protein
MARVIHGMAEKSLLNLKQTPKQKLLSKASTMRLSPAEDLMNTLKSFYCSNFLT